MRTPSLDDTIAYGKTPPVLDAPSLLLSTNMKRNTRAKKAEPAVFFCARLSKSSRFSGVLLCVCAFLGPFAPIQRNPRDVLAQAINTLSTFTTQQPFSTPSTLFPKRQARYCAAALRRGVPCRRSPHRTTKPTPQHEISQERPQAKPAHPRTQQYPLPPFGGMCAEHLANIKPSRIPPSPPYA
ncbi:unnamed protein product [Ectocarpus fasciculatus]